jgi:hypothetical protein
MTSPWWAAFGPTETTVSCGGGKHRLRWSQGSLQALEHPDAQAELVLAALGGETTPCLDLIRAWGKHCDDLSVLAIGPRTGSDELTLTTAGIEEILSARRGPGWARYGTGGPSRAMFKPRPARRGSTSVTSFATSSIHRVSSAGGSPVPAGAGARPAPTSLRQHLLGAGPAGWPGPSHDPDRIELMQLMALGAPFLQRLCGAVAHAWSAGGQHAGHRGRAGPALTAALAGRAAPAVAQWLGVEPGHVAASLHDETGWGEIEAAPGTGERRVHVRLPVGWLASIWAPGLTVVAGSLVVSVLDAQWPAARVLTLRAPGRSPAELSISYDGRGWSRTG